MASLPLEPWHIAPRMAAGALILSSGLDKRGADTETAAGIHGMASTAYPFLDDQDAPTFTETLSRGEIALGTALLAPVVPTGAAALALTAFSGGLLGLYARVPGMRQPKSVRPTQQGLAIAKDVWLLGIGVGLLTETWLTRRRRRSRA
jgi:hypothetical protein